MELFLIRHAQSTNNALPDDRLRVVDPLLTDLGLRQASLLAEHLAHGKDTESWPAETEITNGGNGNSYGITRLYCSAMHRALQTASAVGKALGVQPEVWVDVHEHGGMWLDHGEAGGIVGYPGMLRAEIEAEFPDFILPEAISGQGWWDRRRGHETDEDAGVRAVAVAASLKERAASKEHVAIITHGGFLTLLLRSLIGLPVTARVFFHHDNTGITRVRLWADGYVSVRYQDRIPHLPPEMIS
jgi:2,3-bisphosphoglycerate-dependent phosphoglycerate mutase